MKYYLAYGPNLNLVQMRQRCPNARVVGYTYLFGARLVFRGSKNGCFLTTDFQQPWCPSMVSSLFLPEADNAGTVRLGRHYATGSSA